MWDSELLGLIAAIYKEAGKQEMYLKQRPEELEKLVEIAKALSMNARVLILDEPTAALTGRWKLPRCRVQRRPMPSKALLPRIRAFGSLWKKKPSRRTETSRRLRATGMCWGLFTRVLTRFRLRRAISFSFIKYFTDT